ncbi:MAG: nucleotidyltransferase domain-containing protein [Melioribacteraceae bacterium]|nr:nucleotidyltransferase domain-containing protein [Melioribacteraceae bacterium]
MTIHKYLDHLFSTWSHVAVLRVLNKYVVGLSGREISRLVGMSAKNCLKTLTTLEGLDLGIRNRGGRDHLFRLNRDHYMVNDAIIPLLKIEENYLDRILDDIRQKLKEYSTSIYLFGSVARREEDLQSDLDLCIITKVRFFFSIILNHSIFPAFFRHQFSVF